MKISKLFHWLYALLMFLPLFVFLPTCFYYAFNENALTPTKQVENTTTIHMLQNVVNGLPSSASGWADLNENLLMYENEHIYVESSTGDDLLINGEINLAVNENDKVLFKINFLYSDVTELSISIGNEQELEFAPDLPSSGVQELIFTSNMTENCNYILIIGTLPLGDAIQFKCVQLFNLTQMFGSGNEPTIDDFNSLFPNDYYSVDSNATADVPNGTYTTYPSISDSVALAWNDVWHNDLFSWSYDSFLTVPFTYLTNLFSIPSDNVVIYCFSYWLTISIVWLCFDVIIYVPQIAHRWLDKASLE